MKQLYNHLILIILLGPLLNACATPYVYTPNGTNQPPALIDSFIGVNKSEGGFIKGEMYHYDYSIFTTRIDGSYPTTKEAVIKMSPGKHDLMIGVGISTGTDVFGNKRVNTTQFNYQLDAKPGAHYKLRITPPTAAITDSTGMILKEVTLTESIMVNGIKINTETPITPDTYK